MRLRLATTIAAATALLPLAMAAPAAHADPVYDTKGPAVTVYNTPGGQIVNGRLWNTTCAKYSTSTVRCTTNIWASKITYAAGKYTTSTGWVFNNLTYLPSSRAAWKNNPLGAYGKVKGTATWTSAGRKWRTECDTAATGSGACRSYTWTTYAALVGGKYVMKSGWLFNNQVLFATGSVKPVTTIPAHVLDRAILTPTGLGPFQVGASISNLQKLNYAAPLGTECYSWATPESLRTSRWISFAETRDLRFVGAAQVLPGSRVRTAKGATVGMTIDALRRMYGAALETVDRYDPDYEVYVRYYRVVEGKGALFFLPHYSDSTKVGSMYAALKDTPYQQIWCH